MSDQKGFWIAWNIIKDVSDIKTKPMKKGPMNQIQLAYIIRHGCCLKFWKSIVLESFNCEIIDESFSTDEGYMLCWKT